MDSPTKLLIHPFNQTRSRTLSLEQHGFLVLAGREEFERRITTDFKTMGKLSLGVCVHFGNNKIITTCRNNINLYSFDMVSANNSYSGARFLQWPHHYRYYGKVSINIQEHRI